MKTPQNSSKNYPFHPRVGIRNISDYSPFGVLLKERTVENDFFRRSFNGMESDPEVKGKGNSYDFGARMLDSRIGRWLTVDPLFMKFPDLSSYCFAVNSPIYFNDINGKDIDPSGPFNESPYKPVLDNLIANNSAFNDYFGSFVTNEKYYVRIAISWSLNGKWGYCESNFSKMAGKVTGVEAYISLVDVKKGVWNDLGHAIIMVHEFFHAYAALNGIGGKFDEDHAIWSKYTEQMKNVIREFSTDNNLNLTEDQIYELAIYNISTGGKEYDAYLNQLAEKNGTTYESEAIELGKRVSALIETPEQIQPAETPTENSNTPVIEESQNTNTLPNTQQSNSPEDPESPSEPNSKPASTTPNPFEGGINGRNGEKAEEKGGGN